LEEKKRKRLRKGETRIKKERGSLLPKKKEDAGREKGGVIHPLCKNSPKKKAESFLGKEEGGSAPRRNAFALLTKKVLKKKRREIRFAKKNRIGTPLN